MLKISLALSLFLFPGVQANAQSKDLSPTEPQTITLFSRATHNEYGKSIFNFRHGIRGDAEGSIAATRYYPHLLYGSISLNHDSDWFSVAMGPSSNRIMDMGKLDWADVYYTPYLPANPLVSGIRIPSRNQSFEASSEGRVTKLVVGHIYAVRIKDGESDLYALFRVDASKPNDSCTISWKVVPSPVD